MTNWMNWWIANRCKNDLRQRVRSSSSASSRATERGDDTARQVVVRTVVRAEKGSLINGVARRKASARWPRRDRPAGNTGILACFLRLAELFGCLALLSRRRPRSRCGRWIIARKVGPASCRFLE